ncbi:MAG: ABC transporter ATP-binding protein [Clostridiales bacterium]|nr:ABC transporter ATP-binding protein [Clostridiales bacterium]MCD7828221.1 ABC transporter ATP-binding protein [Clostridiales bacterium]
MSILKLDNVCYQYDSHSPMVLDNLSYEFEAGKVYAVVGKSGAGKTTLLSVLSSLAAPTSGTIYLNDEDITKIDKYEFRSKYVGVIFQNFNLLPHLTAVENVLLSMNISGKKFEEKTKKEIAMELLQKVGLSEDEANRRILKLSGGQQQRVAIARAISYNPDIILADEPTGNLDGETQDEIIDIFKMLAAEGKCIIIVTHSPDVAKAADEIFALKKSSGKKKA